MKYNLKFGLFFVIFFSIFSLNVIAETNELHEVTYVGGFFGTSGLCEGVVTANIVVDNRGDYEEDIYAHIYSNSLELDAFSQVINVDEGSLGNLLFVENVEKKDFLSGFYDVEVEIYYNGKIKNYPEKFFFEGCMKDEQSKVILQGGHENMEERGNSAGDESEERRFSFSLIFSLVLVALVIVLAFVFIISSYLIF